MTVRVYTSQWCGDCFRTKRFLQAQGVEFEEISIDSDEEAARLVMKHNEGKRRVPTIEISGRSFYGNPALDEIAELIGSS